MYVYVIGFFYVESYFWKNKGLRENKYLRKCFVVKIKIYVLLKFILCFVLNNIFVLVGLILCLYYELML